MCSTMSPLPVSAALPTVRWVSQERAQAMHLPARTTPSLSLKPPSLIPLYRMSPLIVLGPNQSRNFTLNRTTVFCVLLLRSKFQKGRGICGNIQIPKLHSKRLLEITDLLLLLHVFIRSLVTPDAQAPDLLHFSMAQNLP